MESNSGVGNDSESIELETECLTHEMLYGRATGFCLGCNWMLPSHNEGCPVSKVRPSVIILSKEEGEAELRKSFIKQRIFKKDVVRSPISVSKRSPATRPKRQDKRELKHCYVCDAQRISKWDGTRWQCVRCASE